MTEHTPEEWLGQILHDGKWVDYARGHEAESRRWQSGDPAHRRLVHWISREVLVAPEGVTARTEVGDQGRTVAIVTVGSVEFTIHESLLIPNTVNVEIDGKFDDGDRMRIHMNDVLVLDTATEVRELTPDPYDPLDEQKHRFYEEN